MKNIVRQGNIHKQSISYSVIKQKRKDLDKSKYFKFYL